MVNDSFANSFVPTQKFLHLCIFYLCLPVMLKMTRCQTEQLRHSATETQKTSLHHANWSIDIQTMEKFIILAIACVHLTQNSLRLYALTTKRH